MRFLPNDGMHTLGYGNNDITPHEESVFECTEIFRMSANEAKSKGLDPSRRYDPNMKKPGAPIWSVWQNRRNDAFVNDRKSLNEGLAAITPDPTDEVSEESSEEDAISSHMTQLRCESPTSL